MERPVDGGEGVDHHDGDGEDGTAVSSDEEDGHQLTGYPGNAGFQRVDESCGQVEDKEQHVCHQSVGHQQVASFLAQGAKSENATQENRVCNQSGQSDDSSGDAEQLQVPWFHNCNPMLREV